MKNILKFIPFILLIIYYLLIHNSPLNSKIKLLISVVFVILSFLSFWRISRGKVIRKKFIPLLISLIISVTIFALYYRRILQ